jgi:pimeloyl-ACP methyl ester carboxylesterase
MSEIVYKNTAIHYLSMGSGKQILIALHGYGDNAALYKVLLPSLGNRYTIYAIDLPYHGRTRWAADRLYYVKDIIGIINTLCESEQITRFSLMGYSMGGRIAMCIIPTLIQQLDEVFILAASGIKIHPIFNAATLPAWAIKLLSFNIKHPKGLFATMRLAKQLGWINPHVYQFNQHLMATENRRRRIHYTWLSIRDFNVNVPKLQQILNNAQIPVYLLFGKDDKIIPPWVGEFFAKGLKNAHLYLLPCNHFMVTAALNHTFDQIFNKFVAKDVLETQN